MLDMSSFLTYHSKLKANRIKLFIFNQHYIWLAACKSTNFGSWMVSCNTKPITIQAVLKVELCISKAVGMRSFKCTTICWILSGSVLREYALCSESQRLISDILELLCDCTELCKCCRLTDCVYSQCESGDYGFSVQTTPQRLVVCSPQSTLANWRQKPLNLDKERNYCNVNTSNTIPCFAPGTVLVAQLSKFKYARTSSGERLPSSFLSLNCWALIKLHFFRKVLTRAGGGFRGLFGWNAYVRPQFASSFTS